MVEIPRISRGAEQARLGGRHQAEFGARTLAEDGHTTVKETLRQGAGMIGDIVPVEARAEGGAGPLQQIEVLEQKRHAGERPLGKPTVNLRPRIVVMPDHHGVDLRIDFFGARDRLVEQFARADLFAADEGCEADRVVIAVFLQPSTS